MDIKPVRSKDDLILIVPDFVESRRNAVRARRVLRMFRVSNSVKMIAV